MTGWELGNCRRYGWDPIVVVFNNRSWEMLRVFQPGSSLYELDDWDFAGCAAPLGGVGVRVSTRREFAAALERALGEGGSVRSEVSLPPSICARAAAFDTEREGNPTTRRQDPHPNPLPQAGEGARPSPRLSPASGRGS
jgi:indolepyruvate decarboxylase